MNRAVSWLLVPVLVIGASLPPSHDCGMCEESDGHAAHPHVHLSKWGLPWQWLVRDMADGRPSSGGTACGRACQAKHEADALYLPETTSTGRRLEVPRRIKAWYCASIVSADRPAHIFARDSGPNAQIRDPHGACPLYVRTMALLI